MRFIQMWFLPAKRGLDPSVEQKAVEQRDRTDRFLPLVSNTAPGALRIVSDAEVLSSFLKKGHDAAHALAEGWGSYLYVLEGGPVLVNGKRVTALSSVMITDERAFTVRAEEDAELLLVDARMA
jgi:hypothetical protein